jgi:hypothetical protein
VWGQGGSCSGEEGRLVLGQRAGWAEQVGTGREAAEASGPTWAVWC